MPSTGQEERQQKDFKINPLISSLGCESAQGDLTITDRFCNIKVWQYLLCLSYMLVLHGLFIIMAFAHFYTHGDYRPEFSSKKL